MVVPFDRKVFGIGIEIGGEDSEPVAHSTLRAQIKSSVALLALMPFGLGLYRGGRCGKIAP